MTDLPMLPADVARHLPLPPRVFAILLSLSQEPRHGYRLMQELREGRAGERWAVGPATLYRTLRRLEQEGLIGGRDGPDTAEGSSGGPPRRYYTLTPLGRRVAQAEAGRMGALVRAARVGALLADSQESPA